MGKSISDHDKAEVGLGSGVLRLGIAAAKYTKNTTVGATTAAAGDMTGAEYVSLEVSAVGAATYTSRTAAQMIADAALQPGDSYTLEVYNSSAGTTTIAGGTGVTVTGTATLATATASRFNVVVGADGASITITRASP